MAVSSQLIFCLFLSIAQTEILDHRFFLGQLIEKYGYNGSMSYEGFERLYTNLGLGNPTFELEKSHSAVTKNISAENATLSRSSREIDNAELSNAQEELAKLVHQHNEVSQDAVAARAPPCLASRDLLAVYGITGHSGRLSPVSFLHLCPAIVYQLDQSACVGPGHSHTHGHDGGTTHSSWFFASLSVLVISVSGLLCVALVPVLNKTFVHQLISFLVALAVGTLLGDALLHLIPHALESHKSNESEKHSDSVMKTGLMFFTVVFFFTIEAVLNTIRNNKENQKLKDNVNYISVNQNQNEKEMMVLAEGAEHSHSHSHLHAHSHTVHSNIAVMVLLGDGLHNLTDGLAIGAAFSGGLAPGFATAVAVFTHELPHELGDFAVLLQAGLSVRQALLYNLLCSIISFLGTVVGLFVGNFGDSTRWIYAITAGSFIYIALSNLVPEMNKQKCSGGTILLRLSGIMCGGALMGCIALFEHDIQHLFL